RVAGERLARRPRRDRLAAPPALESARGGSVRRSPTYLPPAHARRRNAKYGGGAFRETHRFARRRRAQTRERARIDPQLVHLVVGVGKALLPRIVARREVERLESFLRQMPAEQQQL